MERLGRSLRAKTDFNAFETRSTFRPPTRSRHFTEILRDVDRSAPSPPKIPLLFAFFPGGNFFQRTAAPVPAAPLFLPTPFIFRFTTTQKTSVPRVAAAPTKKEKIF